MARPRRFDLTDHRLNPFPLLIQGLNVNNSCRWWGNGVNNRYRRSHRQSNPMPKTETFSKVNLDNVTSRPRLCLSFVISE